jgi:small redox-active disulfide protein 2
MSDKISYLIIGGHKIGLNGLTDILDAVKAMQLLDETEIKELLLEKIKAENYVPPSREEDYQNAIYREFKKAIGEPIEAVEPVSPGIQILILGPGCSACDQMEKDVRAILTELNIAADVDHVRDINQIAEYGMVRTPGLVINGKVILSGRSLPRSQLKNLIQEKLKEFSI